MNQNYEVDKTVNEVDEAMAAGKYRLATEEEKLQVRVAALENLVKSYQNIIAKTYASKKLA
jgi:flagellar capping protein FliD